VVFANWVFHFIAQASVSAALLALGLYFFRALIYERLKNAISHEYARRLENLKAENQRVLDLLRDARTERQAFRSMALGLMTTSHSAALERRLDGIQKLWESIERSSFELPALIAWLDHDLIEWTPDKMNGDELRRLLQDDWKKRFESQASSILAVSEKRPFLGSKLFSLFTAYHSFLGQVISTTFYSLENNNFRAWFEEEDTCALVKQILTDQEYDRFLEKKGRKLRFVLNLLKSKLLDEIQRDLSGAPATSQLIEEANKILDLAGRADRRQPIISSDAETAIS
jgi:hypothetical protein